MDQTAKQTLNEICLEGVITTIPHFVFWKDTKSVYRGCNQNFADLVGLKSPADIVGLSDHNLNWAKQHAAIYLEEDDKILRLGSSILDKKVPLKAKDGKIHIIAVNKVPLRNDKQEIIGILGIFNDITHREEQAIALQRAKSEAESANQLKTEFIRNMEHDIRTPFTGIWGLANHLASKEEDTEKHELLTDIASCAKELLDYCNKILHFSRVESGLFPVIEKKLNIAELVTEVIAMERPPARLKGLELQLDYTNDVPEILIGDHYRVQSILINLMSNAIKFTNEGFVRLVVRAYPQADKRKVVLKLTVKDSGAGISKDKQLVIFQKFTRLEPASHGQHRGYGLGLRIVRKFIDELDGDIEIQSEPGKGSSFICFIPFKVPY